MDKKYLILCVLLVASFLVGKYTATPQVKTVIKTEIKEVVKENKNIKINSKKVSQPDGTVIETTEVVDLSTKESKVEARQEQKITPIKNNVLALSVTPLDFSFSSVNLKYNLDYMSNNLVGPFGVVTGVSTSRQGIEARVGITYNF